jgi:branched-chain amino acid aminotransferase
MPGFFLFNGKVHPGSDPIAGPDCRGLRFGDGLFETIRHTGRGMPLFDLHMDRFFSGLRTLRFDIPRHDGPERIHEQVNALLQKNGIRGQARIRLTAFRGDGGINDPVSDLPQIVIQCWPLPDTYDRLNEHGLVLGVCPDICKSGDGLSALKHNSCLPYLIAAKQARDKKWNDALLLDPFGHVADATIANLFWINEGQVFTPPLSDGPVSGVFRRYLCAALGQEGRPVSEKSVTSGELELAGEIFLTNALFGIRSVGMFAGRPYARTITTQLYRRFVLPLFLDGQSRPE